MTSENYHNRIKRILIFLLVILLLSASAAVNVNGTSKTDGNSSVLLGWQINDGTYSGRIKGNGPFSGKIKSRITVDQHNITVSFKLKDHSVSQIYFGNSYKAADDQANAISGSEGEFTVPVEGLNYKYDMAVYKKGKWQDCKVRFIPSGIHRKDLVTGDIQNGKYTGKITLTGGSGRAHIKSPAVITAKDGRLTAKIIWSSEYYQYIQIGSLKFKKLNKKGNSRMNIPVVPDTDIHIQGLTTAMSTPHLIDYTIRLDKSTMTKADNR